MRRLVVSALTAACAGSALLAPAAGAQAPLTVVGGTDKGSARVAFTRAPSGELQSRINLVVESQVDGPMTVKYVPAAPTTGPDAVTIGFVGPAPQANRGEVLRVSLQALLPRSASPTDLDGVLVLRAGRSEPTLVDVKGDGSAFPGVALEPAALHIRVKNWKGPLDPFDKAGATVLLTGPGVPALFRGGANPPHTVLLLRSRDGKSVYGRIDFLPPEDRSDPTVARAIVSIPGNIDPGRYTVSAPISTLSARSPRLTVELEVADALGWTLLAIVLGAFVAARRDALRTLALTVPVAALYVVIAYGPTWGTALDYAGALAAGFVGQLVLDRVAPRRLK